VKFDQRVSRIETTSFLSRKRPQHGDPSVLRPTLDQAIYIRRQGSTRTASDKKICDGGMTFIWSPDEIIPRYQAYKSLEIISRMKVSCELADIVSQ